MGRDSQETEFELESVELLLETSKSEYENEHNRTTVIDTKTGISLPIIAAYFIALAEMNDYKGIFAFSISSFWDIIIPSLLFLTYTASMLLALVSVLMMVSVIITRDYKSIKPIDLYNNNYLKNAKIFLSIRLVSLYIEATMNNKLQNDKRIPLYRKSWLFSVISIILFIIYIIIKNSI